MRPSRDVRRRRAQVSPLVGVPELTALLASAQPPAVLDIPWHFGGSPGREEWAAGHIPGAAFVDFESALAGPPGDAGLHPLPDPAQFAAAMRRAGVRSDRPVVVYDESAGLIAARCWWLLRHHGHPAARLLDGGLRAWVAARCELEEGEVAPAPGDFEAVTPGLMPVIDAGRAAELASAGTLLDTRAAERYRGGGEPADPVPGHIPGALNAPAMDSVDASGRFLPAVRLAERFAVLGLGPGMDVGVYCTSGVIATHQVLALELAGIWAALYPGSWSEWTRDPRRPVVTGSDPA